MDYHERIEAKVGILFQIADQYVSGQTPLEEAKELLNGEMVHIRPAQFEAMKAELAKRLMAADSKAGSEKLFELFRSYIAPPYSKLEDGHPLKNYFEENCAARALLIRIDEMEDEEAAAEAWKELYESLQAYFIHIERMEKNFYPLLTPLGMAQQVEKANDLGSSVRSVISDNLERLENGNLFDFLFYQRNLSQSLMDYFDLQERALYAKAMTGLSARDFEKLREADDKTGYAYIQQPPAFVPKEKPKQTAADPALILPALLAAKEIGIVYYSLSGEVVSVMGKQITEADLPIPLEIRKELQGGFNEPKRYSVKQGDQTCLITYSIVKDSSGNRQGILKTKEFVVEDVLDRNIDSSRNIAELFDLYPAFKEDFFLLNEELAGLKGPYGMNLLKDSTVEMLAKSLRLDTEDLVSRINELLKSY